MSWARRAGATWLSLVCLGATTGAAQGVAGAAIQGAITPEDSTAVQDATGLMTNGAIAGFPDLTIPTLEGIEEVQIVSAPFDVRYGSFSGGLVNAVTKSGTNRLTGSA